MRRRTNVSPSIALIALLLSAQGTQAASQAPTAPSYPNTDSFGVPFTTSEEWHRQCMRVAALPPLPVAGTKAPPASCDATDLYYQKRDQKHTSAAEWREVHACARASNDDAVLMMLFANGYGVQRDADRAIQHACRLDSAKAEMEGRVSYLASGALLTDSQPFDLCDQVTSDYMRSVCVGLRDVRVARAYNVRLDRFAEELVAPARKPFAQLRKAADAFTRQSAAEVDLSSTSGVVFYVDHSARRRDEFLQAVLDMAAGKIPPVSRDELARLDNQRTALYRKLTTPRPGAHKGRIGNSTVTIADVRATERAWLAYRDAWMPYLAASGMPVDPISLQAMLTRQRIAQLSRL